MAMTRQEIDALGRNRQRLVELCVAGMKASAREDKEWKDSLINKIRRAPLSRADLFELHVWVDVAIARIADRRAS